MIQITQTDARDIASLRDQLQRVYLEAFAGPPYQEGEAEAESAIQALLVQHSRRPGFRLFVAREDGGPIVGFSYGYHGQPGQWWHDFVSRLLSPDVREHWLTNCFQFVELAVLPSAQGRGIGGKLHDALLADLTYRTAVLSTFSGENQAMHLYKSRGWTSLVPELHFPGSRVPLTVLGLELTPRTEAERT